MSNLMGRAGFTLLTVDVEEVKVTYPSMWELMEDLKDMGESNAVLGRYDLTTVFSDFSNTIAQAELHPPRHIGGCFCHL